MRFTENPHISPIGLLSVLEKATRETQFCALLAQHGYGADHFPLDFEDFLRAVNQWTEVLPGGSDLNAFEAMLQQEDLRDRLWRQGLLETSRIALESVLFACLLKDGFLSPSQLISNRNYLQSLTSLLSNDLKLYGHRLSTEDGDRLFLFASAALFAWRSCGDFRSCIRTIALGFSTNPNSELKTIAQQWFMIYHLRSVSLSKYGALNLRVALQGWVSKRRRNLN